MKDHLKVLLVSPHAIIRHGLRSLLHTGGIEVVADVAPGEELIALTQSLVPDIILMDIYQPDTFGIPLAKQLQVAQPDSQVVFLSASQTELELRAAMDARVAGYFSKAIDTERLVNALYLIAEGETIFPHCALTLKNRPAAANPVVENLTNREQEILCHVARGLSNKTIARELSLAEGTVKVHLKAILRKLELTNRTQAAVYVLKQMPEVMQA